MNSELAGMSLLLQEIAITGVAQVYDGICVWLVRRGRRRVQPASVMPARFGRCRPSPLRLPQKLHDGMEIGLATGMIDAHQPGVPVKVSVGCSARIVGRVEVYARVGPSGPVCGPAGLNLVAAQCVAPAEHVNQCRENQRVEGTASVKAARRRQTPIGDEGRGEKEFPAPYEQEQIHL